MPLLEPVSSISIDSVLKVKINPFAFKAVHFLHIIASPFDPCL
jgi:hypothetical protein